MSMKAHSRLNDLVNVQTEMKLRTCGKMHLYIHPVSLTEFELSHKEEMRNVLQNNCVQLQQHCVLNSFHSNGTNSVMFFTF